MKTLSRSLSLSLALALTLPAAPAGATVRVRIHSGGSSASGSAGAVKPVQLGAMELGGKNAPTLNASTLPGGLSGIRVRGVSVEAPADLAVAEARYPRLAETRPAAGSVIEASGRAAAAPARDEEAQTAAPRSERALKNPPASPAGKKEGAAARIDIRGEAAASANLLSEGLIALGGAGVAASGGVRETIGASFDGHRRLQAQELLVGDEPVRSAELFSSGRALRVPAAEAERLSTLADETARWRGTRATQGEEALEAAQAAVLRGIDDLARAVALAKTSPAVLQHSADIVERMPLEKLRRFSELAWSFLNTEVAGKSTPFARVGNVEHVEQQLLDPLKTDGDELAAGYKTNPRQSAAHFVEMLRALQLATDTGKQQNPDDLKAALAAFNPQGPVWYINNFILPHEYASMIWAEKFGKEAGFSSGEILAFQRLIANHNFGPDLSDPKNKALREHWWPKNFREQMFPMLAAMGIPVEEYFKTDEEGTLQYNNTQGHPYALLLSVYDRAIAVPANGYGLATWKKYGTQDFNQKKGALKGLRERNAKAPPGKLLESDPSGARDENGKAGPIFEFDGPAVVKAMQATADWAQAHVESLWASLYASLPADSPLRRQFPTPQSFRDYGPFLRHRKAIGSLQTAIRLTGATNPTETNRADILPGDGVAYYEAQNPGFPGVYRVRLARTGPGAFDPRSTDYRYEARLEAYLGPGHAAADKDGWGPPQKGPFSAAGPAAEGRLPTRSEDPVALLLDLIRRDKGW